MMRTKAKRRGFALLVVMLIVSLVGIGAAALLDIVNVDIGIVGEMRNVQEAEGAATAGVLETLADPNLRQRLPNIDTPTLRTRLMTRQAGAYTLDPDGSPQSVDEDTSVVLANVGTSAETGYESDITLLRVVPRENTSLRFAVAAYEVRARASVARGGATRESRAVVYEPVAVGTDDIARQRHFR